MSVRGVQAGWCLEARGSNPVTGLTVRASLLWGRSEVRSQVVWDLPGPYNNLVEAHIYLATCMRRDPWGAGSVTRGALSLRLHFFSVLWLSNEIWLKKFCMLYN